MPANEAANKLELLVHDVVAEAQKLRKDITEYEDAHRRERRAYRLIGVILIGAILLCLLLLGTSRASLKSNHDTLEYVKSCTTPAGKCYQASRASTVDFRGQLLGVIAIITDCDVSNDDLASFRKCVKGRTGLDASLTIPGGTDPTK